MMRDLRAQLEFARIGFMNMVAFRLRYYTGVINYIVNVTVYYFIWKAIYEQTPQFAGFSFPQMITYVVVGWVIRSLYFSSVDVELSQDIQEGKIVMSLLRPISVMSAYVCRSLAKVRFGFCF